MEQKVNFKALAASVYRATTAQTKAAFSIPDGATVEDVETVLIASYRGEVERIKRDFVWDQATQSNIRFVARWMVESKRSSLIMLGTIGSGKSTMARAIITTLRAFGNKICTVSAPSLIEVKYNADFQNKVAFTYDSLTRADIVVLDELGVEPETIKNYGTEELPIHDFLYRRYDNPFSSTIITTNLNFEEISRRYGDRIRDRIEERYSVLVFKQESYRRIR